MRAGLGGTSPTHKATNIIACARRFLFLRSVLVERPSAVDGCGHVTYCNRQRVCGCGAAGVEEGIGNIQYCRKKSYCTPLSYSTSNLTRVGILTQKRREWNVQPLTVTRDKTQPVNKMIMFTIHNCRASIIVLVAPLGVLLLPSPPRPLECA